MREVFCHKCGSKLPSDSLFCQYCGCDVSAASPANHKAKVKPKKFRRVFIIAAAAALVIIAIACAIFAFPVLRYQRACASLENGDYSTAIEIFDALDGYRDSVDKIKEAKYQYACAAIKSKEYPEAVRVFEELGSYLDSKDKISEAKYQYVLRNMNNDDYTTFEYIKDLKAIDYKNCASLYKNLYEWKLIVEAVNTDEFDTATNLTTLSKSSPVYIHVKLTGGEPDASILITAKVKLPNNKEEEHIFDERWKDGHRGSLDWPKGIYTYPEYGRTGAMSCFFYDENNNLIGVDFINIGP